MESDPRSVQWKRVSSVEEFFDVIAAHHLLEDGSHLGIKKTLGRVSFNFLPVLCMYVCIVNIGLVLWGPR